MNTQYIDRNDRKTICQLASQYVLEDIEQGEQVIGPDKAIEVMRLHLKGKRNEALCVMFLDLSYHVIAFEEMFRGDMKQTSAYPRVIAQRALELNAAHIIIAHNHPGVPKAEASDDDISLTKRLMKALELIDVQLLDHVVFADRGEPYSMVKNGDIHDIPGELENLRELLVRFAS